MTETLQPPTTATPAAPVTPAAIPHQPGQADPILVLNPAVSVIRCSDNEVFIRHGSRSTSSHRIEDTEGRGRLASFVEAFAHPTRLSAAASTTDTALADAREFVKHLCDGKALLTEAEARYAHLVAGLAGGGVPQTTAVCVAGQGRVADAVARQLSDLLGTPVGQEASLVEAFETADLVVVASDHPNPGLGYDADEAAAATSTPWQMVWVDGSEAVVGPTFVPGMTASFYDMDTMDESGRTMRTEHQFLTTAVPAVAGTSPVPLVVADLAASYASLAVVQHLTGRGSFLENHLLRVDLERMHVIRERVMRLARNPRDVASRDDLRHPFL